MSLLNAVPFRPFTKYVLVNPNQTSGITLTDTAGSAISCNYIQATLFTAISNAGFITVEPSGISRNVRNPLQNTVSSTLCVVGTVLDPAELYLGGADYCSAINVSGSSGLTAASACITYGVLKEPNSFKTYGRNIGR